MPEPTPARSSEAPPERPPPPGAAAGPLPAGPRARWRRAWRLAALAAITAIDYPLITVGAALAGRSDRRRAAWRHRVFRRWCRRLVRILGVRVEARGPVPEPPYLLVANHLSWLDVFVLGAVAGGTFVARADVDGWPVFGALTRSIGTVFIDRESKRDLLRVGELVEARLAAGAGVVLFAEGTTGGGAGLLPFKPSVLEAAARSGRPVHYATLSYRTPPGAPPASAVVPWAGDDPFLAHAREVLALPAAAATVTFGPQPIRDDDRKRLAARLRAAMEGIFEPTL
jgi:1-acyl-sn-glycerol-3-phosphate acyltransferase